MVLWMRLVLGIIVKSCHLFYSDQPEVLCPKSLGLRHAVQERPHR